MVASSDALGHVARMRTTMLVLIWATMSLLPATARAETSVNNFLKILEEADAGRKKALVEVIHQQYYGMTWVNSYLVVLTKEKGAHGLWCPPKGPLTGEQVLDLLKQFVEKHPDRGKDPIGAGILFAAMDAFPCSK